MPFAHVDEEAALAGRAPAVSIPTHHFPAAGVIEIIWDILQKGSQLIELPESFSLLVEEIGSLSWPSSTLARLTCVARHIVRRACDRSRRIAPRGSRGDSAGHRRGADRVASRSQSPFRGSRSRDSVGRHDAAFGGPCAPYRRCGGAGSASVPFVPLRLTARSV